MLTTTHARTIAMAVALGVAATLVARDAAQAHPCNKGVKRAHCYCINTLGSTELARIVNHGQCYNQQANAPPFGACANYCKGLTSTLIDRTRDALLARGLCGKRTVARKYAAGTNPYVPYGFVTLTAC